MSDWFDLPDPVIAALRAKLQEAEVEKDQLRMDRDRLQSQVDICYYKDSVKEIARLQAEVARLRVLWEACLENKEGLRLGEDVCAALNDLSDFEAANRLLDGRGE